MREHLQFYIGGEWVDPASAEMIDVIDPATEAICGLVAAGGAAEVNRAATAAKHAFRTYSQTSRSERSELLHEVLAQYLLRLDDVADAITEEMGCPSALSRKAQAEVGRIHLEGGISALESFVFEEDVGPSRIRREPIGVCGMITPWNWPINQIAAKVVPALAAGCTMVLKPSEEAPFSAQIWAEVMHDAGVPAGVFNLVGGRGAEAGAALASHPDVDMISFTGSTRAGAQVAIAAAPTVKRVAQELGGKSPCIVLDDDQFERGVRRCVRHVMRNSGQSCNAPTRLLVPARRAKEAAEIARRTTDTLVVGPPRGQADLGPVVNGAQWERIQRLIGSGVEEGAELVTGGLGRPSGLNCGFYVRPTVFASVGNSMTIAREEIFGPVVSILPYESLQEAVEIANDTDYGLAAYISGEDLDACWALAGQLRAGQVSLNGADDDHAPFGGYKRSGNGREGGVFGIAEYLEVKAIMAPAGP